MAKAYVKYEAPAEAKAKALEAIELAKGGLRKGTNEVTKAIERGEAKLVVIAEDVEPEEIVMHLPMLCQEKRIPYTYVNEKAALGKAAGLLVGTAAIAITKPGAGEAVLKELLNKISGMAPGVEAKPAAEKPAAEKAEKKPAAKKKAPAKKAPAAAEEKKEEKK